MKEFLVILTGVCIVLLLSVNSCKHEPEVKVGSTDTTGNGGVGTGNPCDKDSVYFTNDILPIIQSNCAFVDCHGAGSAKAEVDLSNYTTIMKTADVVPGMPGESDFYAVLNSNDTNKVMPRPPALKLTADQIALISKWIQQGAKNNKCDGCDTTIVTFSGVISKIIQNNCTGCHSGASPQGGISLNNYTEVNTIVQDGSLFGSINHESGFVAMPYKIAKLNQCNIDKMRIWIEAGALND